MATDLLASTLFNMWPYNAICQLPIARRLLQITYCIRFKLETHLIAMCVLCAGTVHMTF